MNRRGFIRVMTASGTVALLPSIFTPKPAEASGETGLEAWDGPAAAESDIRRIVLSYAILAPNPHNKQPWIVDFTGPESFDLYVDRERLLPQTDPPFRQIHVGQGTFLENLVLAAGHHGYRADLSYFPRGTYPNDLVENKPVAAIRLERDSTIAGDPLFSQILTRQSNKRSYDAEALTADELSSLRDVRVPAGLTLKVSDEASLRSRLAEILEEAMRVEVADKYRDAETLEMFRINDEERARFRDGFGIAQSGTTGPMQWIVETFFLDRQDLEVGTTFGDRAVKMAGEQASSAAAFGWLVSNHNERLDQVVTGHLYERISLTATALGIAMHPMSQVLEEYPDMKDLQQRFLSLLGIPKGHTVQMFFRLGKADPVPHTARRRLSDMMRTRGEA